MTAVGRRKEISPQRGRKPELKVVRRAGKGLIKRTGTRRMAPLTILGAIAIGAIVGGVLLEQVVLAQSAFRLAEIRRQLEVAEEDREVLMLEAAKLDSAARIERYARENLGMVDPAPQDVRYIVADIRPGTATGAMLASREPLRTRARAVAGAPALGLADTP